MTALILLAAAASAGLNPLTLAAIPFGLLAAFRARSVRQRADPIHSQVESGTSASSLGRGAPRFATTPPAPPEQVIATLYLRKGRLRLRRRAS